MINVEVYGTDWCPDTQHTLQQLEHLGVACRYVNIERHPHAAEWVKSQNGGKQKVPTIKVGEQILSVPDDEELTQALRQVAVLS